MNDVRHIDSALHTKYSTVNPNETIQLYEGLLEIEHNNTKISLNGIIEFVWLRSPQIKFSFVNLTPLSTNKINFDVIHLHIPNCVQPVQVRSLNSRHISNEKGQRHEYFGRVMNPICLGNGQNLNSVILHLANFHDTDGKAIKNGGKEWNGRFYLNI